MKKLILIVACLVSTGSYAKVVNIKTAVIPNIIGALNIGVDINVFGNFTIGLGGLSWSSKVLNSEFDDQETSFLIKEYHAGLAYWFNGAFNDGFYVGGEMSQIAIELENESNGNDFTGDASSTGFKIETGYHWQWSYFNIDLGVNYTSYDFESDLELKASNGATQTEDLPKIAGPGLEFNIGIAF